MSIGRIHSVETMGLVDGPGIRFVVFMQGCALRCRFCHNPDTWNSGGEEITPEALTERILRFRTYFQSSGGGVTFSGGEPLMHPEFLTDTLALLKHEGIHTCIDTAGYGLGDYDSILSLCDLVLYDVKHTDPDGYREMTGREIAETERFLSVVKRAGTPVWVRQVVVPGLTDSEEYIKTLREYIRDKLPTAQKTELLPYHLLGVNKYKSMGLAYPLEGVPAMDKRRCEELERLAQP